MSATTLSCVTTKAAAITYMPKEDLITLRSLLLDYQMMLEQGVKNDDEVILIHNVGLIIETIEQRVQYSPPSN